MGKVIETIAKTNEKARIDKIIEFTKSLDESGQEAFINLMIGFNMAQNLLKNSKNLKVFYWGI